MAELYEMAWSVEVNYNVVLGKVDVASAGALSHHLRSFELNVVDVHDLLVEPFERCVGLLCRSFHQ